MQLMQMSYMLIFDAFDRLLERRTRWGMQSREENPIAYVFNYNSSPNRGNMVASCSLRLLRRRRDQGVGEAL